MTDVKHRPRSSPNVSKLHLYSATLICVFQIILIMCLAWIGMYKLIGWLQRYLYQNPGEILFGGNLAMIPGLILGVCIGYWMIVLLFYIEDKYFPRLMKYVSIEGAIKLDDAKVMKVNNVIKKVTVIMMPIVIILLYVCLNEYISLGKDYIVASSASIFPNRKEYAYSDIRIIKERQLNGSTYSWVSGYRFTDGRRTIGGGLGNDSELIREVRNTQRSLGLRVSDVEKVEPKKPNMYGRFISILIFGSAYFFVARFFSKMRKK